MNSSTSKLMTAIKSMALVTVILLSASCTNLGEKTVKNECFSFSYPSGWKLTEENVGDMLTLAMVNKNSISYVVMSMQHYMDPEYYLTNQVVEKTNSIFRDGESGEISSCQYYGREAKTISSQIRYNGKPLSTKTFCFNDNGRTIMIVEMLGKYDCYDFSEIAKSLVVFENESGESDVRSYVQKMLDDLVLLGYKGSDMGDGVTAKAIGQDPNENILIYSYTLDFISKSDLENGDKEIYESTMREYIAPALKVEAKNNALISRCMESNYKFEYKYYDTDDNLLFDIMIAPEEYK